METPNSIATGDEDNTIPINGGAIEAMDSGGGSFLSQLDKLKEINTSLLKEIETLRKKDAKRNTKMQTQGFDQEIISVLKQDNRRMTDENKDLTAQVKRLKEAAQEGCTRWQAETRAKCAALEEVETLKTQVAALQKSKSATVQEVENLKMELATLQKSKKEADAIILDIEEQARAFKAVADSHISQLEKSDRNLRSLIDADRRTCNELINRVEKLRDGISSYPDLLLLFNDITAVSPESQMDQSEGIASSVLNTSSSSSVDPTEEPKAKKMREGEVKEEEEMENRDQHQCTPALINGVPTVSPIPMAGGEEMAGDGEILDQNDGIASYVSNSSTVSSVDSTEEPNAKKMRDREVKEEEEVENRDQHQCTPPLINGVPSLLPFPMDGGEEISGTSEILVANPLNSFSQYFFNVTDYPFVRFVNEGGLHPIVIDVSQFGIDLSQFNQYPSNVQTSPVEEGEPMPVGLANGDNEMMETSKEKVAKRRKPKDGERRAKAASTMRCPYCEWSSNGSPGTVMQHLKNKHDGKTLKEARLFLKCTCTEFVARSYQHHAKECVLAAEFLLMSEDVEVYVPKGNKRGRKKQKKQRAQRHNGNYGYNGDKGEALSPEF